MSSIASINSIKAKDGAKKYVKLVEWCRTRIWIGRFGVHSLDWLIQR